MTLEELIASQPEPRELKRALVVKMRIQGMKLREIQALLGVYSSSKYRTKIVMKQETHFVLNPDR